MNYNLEPIKLALQGLAGVKQDTVIGKDTLAALYAKLAGKPWQFPEDAQQGGSAIVSAALPLPAGKPAYTGLIHNDWPQERDAEAFFGYPPQLVKFVPPFALHTWDGGWKPVPSFSCNAKVIASLTRIFAAILAHYGTQEAIARDGMDVFDGCYNDRNKRQGGGRSMHAYGAALDWNAERWPQGSNGAMPQAVRDIFHAEGWRTGDQYAGLKDPMHAEACR